MILDSIPPLVVSALMLLSHCALLGLAVWVVILFVSEKRQQAMGASPFRYIVMITALLALGAPALWRWEVNQKWEYKYEDAANHFTVKQPMRLSGYDVPAGTQLTLDSRNDPEHFDIATFPHPIPIAGMMATRLRNMRDPELRGEGTQTIEGWRCDTTQDVTFAKLPNNTFSLRFCTLAQGNQITLKRGANRTLDIPADTKLIATEGTLYGDGYQDADQWRLDAPRQTALNLAELVVRWPSLRLDKAREFFSLDSGTLACDLRLGEMRYATGTSVRSAPRGLRERWPDAWVFLPQSSTVKWRNGVEDLTGQKAVVQAPDGTVLAVIDANKSGIIQFQEFYVEGEKPPPKPDAVQCPPADAALPK